MDNTYDEDSDDGYDAIKDMNAEAGLPHDHGYGWAEANRRGYLRNKSTASSDAMFEAVRNGTWKTARQLRAEKQQAIERARREKRNRPL